jgi:hypothetical protein
MSFQPTSHQNMTYIDNANRRPGYLFQWLIMLFVISNPRIIVLDSLVLIPSTILQSLALEDEENTCIDLHLAKKS